MGCNNECNDCKNFFCEGTDKAPQRSLFNALGFTKEEMEDFDDAISKVTVYGKWDESAIFMLKDALKKEGYDAEKVLGIKKKK